MDRIDTPRRVLTRIISASLPGKSGRSFDMSGVTTASLAARAGGGRAEQCHDQHDGDMFVIEHGYTVACDQKNRGSRDAFGVGVIPRTGNRAGNRPSMAARIVARRSPKSPANCRGRGGARRDDSARHA